MTTYIIRKKSTGEEKVVEAPSREAALASLIENLFDVVEQTDLFGQSTSLATSRPPLATYVENLWRQLAHEFPNVCGIRHMNHSRRIRILSRAQKQKGPGQDVYAVWDEIFSRIRGNLFLTGRAPPGKDRVKPFGLTIEYVLRENEFGKILEGAYPHDDNGHRDIQRAYDPDTGRRYSATEQAARIVLDDRIHRGRGADDRRGAPALR